MQTLYRFAGSLIVLLGFAGTVSAQERHVVAPSVLAEAVAGAGAQQDLDREAIRATLAREDLRELAARAGINLDLAAKSVDTLDTATLAHAAAAARQIDRGLVGGASTITLSTTTIIIALLVLILIIVAVD